MSREPVGPWAISLWRSVTKSLNRFYYSSTLLTSLFVSVRCLSQVRALSRPYVAGRCDDVQRVGNRPEGHLLPHAEVVTVELTGNRSAGAADPHTGRVVVADHLLTLDLRLLGKELPDQSQARDHLQPGDAEHAQPRLEGGTGVGVHRPVVGIGPWAGVGHEDEVDPGDRLAPGQLDSQPRFATGIGQRGPRRGGDVPRRRDLDALLSFRLHLGHRLGVDPHTGVQYRPLLAAVDQPNTAPLLFLAIPVEQPDELVGGVDRA